MGGSMSVARWGSDWVSENGMVLRRAEGLSKMMALSFILHLGFFFFILYGRSFWGLSSGGLQSYQVTLVSPSSGSSAPSVTPLSASSSPSAPLQSSASPAPTLRPSSSQRSSPPVAASKPLSSKGVPPVKEDPERLQEWWKKKAGSIKIPPVQQSKNDPAPSTPAQIIKRPMATPAPVETNPTAIQNEGAAGPSDRAGPPHPGGASTSAPGQEGGNSSVIATGSIVIGGGGPGGSGTGGSGTGGGGTGSGPLNASLFKFPFYLKNIENKISGQWSPPPALLQEQIVGAIVQFNVTRRGSIESVEIEKSSGNSQFDQAALRAIYNANPLPPLPDGLAEDPLKVHFSFTLQRGS